MLQDNDRSCQEGVAWVHDSGSHQRPLGDSVTAAPQGENQGIQKLDWKCGVSAWGEAEGGVHFLFLDFPIFSLKTREKVLAGSECACPTVRVDRESSSSWGCKRLLF